VNVYLLYRGSHEDRDVDSVHATLASAMLAHGEHHQAAFLGGDRATQWICQWELVHPGVPAEDLTFGSLIVPVVDGKATLPDGRVIEVHAMVTSLHVPVPPRAIGSWTLGWTDTCDVSIAKRAVRP
jgi:hypothetical protein